MEGLCTFLRRAIIFYAWFGTAWYTLNFGDQFNTLFCNVFSACTKFSSSMDGKKNNGSIWCPFEFNIGFNVFPCNSLLSSISGSFSMFKIPYFVSTSGADSSIIGRFFWFKGCDKWFREISKFGKFLKLYVPML